MALIHLVRHGRAAGGWDSDPDPGLDDLGVAQAREVATRLPRVGAGAVFSSPLRRCRETAAFYGEQVEAEIAIEPAVTEIPAPLGVAMEGRVDWLRRVMVGAWGELDDRYATYRTGVVNRIAMCDVNTIIFSHFVAINAVIGAALDDDRLVIRRLDNCSVTIVEVIDGSVTLVEGGHEANTLVR